MIQQYKIYATNGDGEKLELFTWRGDPLTGIHRAQADAVEFKHTDLRNYVAEPIGSEWRI